MWNLYKICLTTGEIYAIRGRNPHFIRMKSNPSFNPTKSDIVRRISLAEGEIIPSVKTDLVEKASLSDAFSMVCLTGFVSAKRSERSREKPDGALRYFIFLSCANEKRRLQTCNRLKMVCLTGIEPATVRIGI